MDLFDAPINLREMPTFRKRKSDREKIAVEQFQGGLSGLSL
jgi:hypothetical protein